MNPPDSAARYFNSRSCFSCVSKSCCRCRSSSFLNLFSSAAERLPIGADMSSVRSASTSLCMLFTARSVSAFNSVSNSFFEIRFFLQSSSVFLMSSSFLSWSFLFRMASALSLIPTYPNLCDKALSTASANSGFTCASFQAAKRTLSSTFCRFWTASLRPICAKA